MTDKLPEHKMAPVQGWPQGIPWSLHLEAYAAYCKKWGPQPALIEGWCRGGFGTEELDEFIPGWRDKVSEITRLRTENADLRTTLETERMRLVACGVVANADTPESAATARDMHADYRSAALDDVIRRVDECLVLRATLKQAREALDSIKRDHWTHWPMKDVQLVNAAISAIDKVQP
jgi:hypothetical protein